jgi:type IV secretory pathway component VirB8
VYYGTIMHPPCREWQEAGIIGIMNASSVIWAILGVVLLLIVLRVFGII